MELYLPIAEISLSAPILVLLGTVIGFLSGLFGVGGGFLMTPVLILMGVPPSVAVASQTGTVVASSASSVITYGRQGLVDYRMAWVMASGGIVGAFLGVELFHVLRQLGQAELVISVLYLLLLGVVGSMMLFESLMVIIRRQRGQPLPPRPHDRPSLLYGLPFKMRFNASGLYISVLPPIAFGVFVGLLSAIMGVGGGFVLVPMMVYLLRMKAKVVVGTSLMQILVTASTATVLHAVRNHTVDGVLMILLTLGGVIGAQIGARLSARFRADELRALLAIIVLAAGLQMGMSLFVPPKDPFAQSQGGE